MISPPVGAWHIITPEYPPQVGGVADYTAVVATALSHAGQEVHIWCPDGGDAPPADSAGVSVHRSFGTFSPADLWRVGRLLNRQRSPRRLLVQWVPHGYGLRSLNVVFAAWLAWRTWARGDVLSIMIHEPFVLASWDPRTMAVAAAHRAMLWLACCGASTVWLSIPAWADLARPYLGGKTPRWLPVPAPMPLGCVEAEIKAVRSRLFSGKAPVIGHFGTYTGHVTPLLIPTLEAILRKTTAEVLLLGRGSREFRRAFLESQPDCSARVHASGTLDGHELAAHVHACDLMVQPYVDGISARRTSSLALLAAGMPIATNRGWLTEPFWADGAVLMADAPDGDKLAAAAKTLLDDEPLRRTVGTCGARLYASTFDIRHAVALLLQSPA